MRAYILDAETNQIGDQFEIESDNDFNLIEDAAKSTGQKCCIKWDRSSDGQVGFWSPSGATFDPYWYND